MAYLAPIHRPSSVRHAIHLAFLAPESADLIVAKANRLEIWSPTPNAPDLLTLRHIKTLYGKVTLLHRLRPATSPTDHVFVGTDRYHYFTLSWDAAAREIKTEKSYVDVAEKAARDSQTGDRVHIDPTERFMTLECYEGVVNVIPISQAGGGKGKRKATAAGVVGDLQDPIPVRIPELHVRSTCFLHKRQPGPRASPPAFAVLQEDSMNRPRLKVRELDFAASLRPHEEPSTAVLNNAHDVQGELELGASHLIPLPPPIYGFLVVGETSVSYVEEWEYRVHHTEPLDAATVFVAWCAIDTQRYALADDYGTLYLLFVHQKPDGEYAGHVIDVLGTTSRASTLVYLDSGRIFVGSHQGDSQVVRIVEKGLEVLQTFPNIAPILDFTIMDMGNRSADAPVNEFSSGQARLVTGSGAFKDGSLRSVRSGVGLENLASLGEMHGPVSGLFSLRSGRAKGGTKVDTLVVSFVHVTRVFLFELSSDAEAGAGAGPEVEEVETFSGFDMGQCTLYAGNLDGGGGEDGARIVQVTSFGVVITDGDDGGMAMESWRPPQGASITAVAAEGRRFLLSLGGAVLVALEVGNNGNITVMAQREFAGKEQISCIALSSTLPDMCVVGFWHESRVAFLSLPTLDVIAAELVAVDNDVGATSAALTVPRSLVVAKLLPAQPPTLFVGLADGNVVSYIVESMQHPFTARKSMVLGTQQPNFALLPRYTHIADNEGGVGAEESSLHNVFATCEHPSLIYGNEGRVVYSAVTAEGAQGICSFDSAAFPGAIAIAVSTAAFDNDEGMGSGGRGAEVKLALVDEERTTHVQTLPVHETVRRVAYSAELRAFGLGCIRRTLAAGEEIVESSFRLVDEVAFQELHAYALNKDELVESCMRCGLDNGAGELAERFVVGTAYLDDQEGEGKNARGRLLVFEITEERQLKVVTELKLRGACRCLGMCEGRIVAALIKTIVIFSFEYQTPSTPFLVKKAAYRTSTAPIDLAITGSLIAVTDLMKSLSLVQYTPGHNGMPDELHEVARHFETVWGTAVAHLGEHLWLQADAEGNLIVLERDVTSYDADDRRRMRVVSEMLLGEMVNRIRPVPSSLAPSTTAVVVPRAFLATVEGGVYVLGLIAPGKQDLLIRLQARMAELVLSPGGIPFNKFRGFRSQVRDCGEEGPTRFVDGELVETFLDLSAEAQEVVGRELGVAGGGEEVRGLVEGLKRIH